MDKAYKKHAFRIAIGITMLTFLLIGMVQAALPRTVCPDGCDYSSIQDAINAANSGDTIEVYSGTYYENVNVNKQLILRSENNLTTIIDGSGSGDVINVTVNGVIIERFTIQNGLNGIYVTSSNNEFLYNIIREMHGADETMNYTREGGFSFGINLSGSSNNIVTGNTINNITGGAGGSGMGTDSGGPGGFSSGIYLSVSTNNTLTGNTINNITGGTGGPAVYGVSSGSGGLSFGIYLSDSTNNTLRGNTINNITGGKGGMDAYQIHNGPGEFGYSIYLETSISNKLFNNTLENLNNNAVGIYLYYSNSNLIYNNYFNNFNNVRFTGSNINTWNTTMQSGTNIIGGKNLGGNFWVHPNGMGFGPECDDYNGDGICDSAYELENNNIDYLPLAAIVTPTSHRVHNNNTGKNYTTIQAAIKYANEGDEIHVDSGTYFGDVNIDKRINLRGIGMPVVDAMGSANAITLSADGITLAGFTATGAGYGIRVNSNNNILSGNNALKNFNGIYLSISSNNTLSGNNASLNTECGIYLEESSNNTLTGNNALNNSKGISLSSSNNNILEGNNGSSNSDFGIIVISSSNNTLNGNNALNNNKGIILRYSGNNMLKNNVMDGNNYNFGLDWSTNSDFDNQIDTTNLVNGKTVYYIKGSTGTVYDSSTLAGTFYCINCVNVTIKDLDLKNNTYGILFWNTTYSKIQNVNASNNYISISLDYSDNNMLIGNNVSNSYFGISVSSSSSNKLIGNNALNNLEGIYLGAFNSTLIGNNASNNFNYGIHLESSSNSTLSDNYASNNGIGIYLLFSRNNILKNNLMNGNKYNFDLYGYSNSDFDNQIDTTNLVDRKAIFYVKDAVDSVYDFSTNAGTFYCISCVNVTVKNIDLKNNYYGILFWNANSSKIQNVNISNSYFGISLSSSNNNVISDSFIANNLFGIRLDYSSNNTFGGNNASSNNYGVWMGSSKNNTLSGNNVYNNNYGIWMEASKNNTLTGNIVYSNNKYGISLDHRNEIYVIYNNIFNNPYNVYFFTMEVNFNAWNTTMQSVTNIIGGLILGGNFWANPDGTGFSQTCRDDDDDGICDSGYEIDKYNFDYLPLALKDNAYPVHNINKSKDYATIQTAIDDALPGNEIQVDSGTYYENVIVNKQLTLRGIGMPIVNASGSGSAITLAADGIGLYGFTVIGSGYYSESGINVISNNNTLSGNNANSNVVGIRLDSSSNNTLTGNNANSNNLKGIWMYDSSNNKLSGNNVLKNSDGIWMHDSSNNNLSGNNVSNNLNGIYLDNSNNGTLNNNYASNNLFGIYLDNSNNVTLGNNNASNNNYGISLVFSSYSMLSNNNASNNSLGIYLYSSSNNKIYENNFVDNQNQALDQFDNTNTNSWDDDYPSGGNYWSNYNGDDLNSGPSQNIIGSDGIGDTPYPIPGGSSEDRYPLIAPIPPDIRVESITGEGTVYFDIRTGTIQDLTVVNPNDIPDSPPSEANLNYGLFRFNITGVTLGGSTTLTLTFPEDLPAGTTYWKYGANITNSTPHWYTITSAINGNEITITLVDGGDGDDDLTVNGIIKDDGGPSLPVNGINIAPVAKCGGDQVKCENVGAPVQFNGSSSYDPDGATISYYWDFGDGTNATGAAPNHTYSAYKWNGTGYESFIADLMVTDASGLTNKTSHKVVIRMAGDANGDGKVNILDASVIGLKWNGNDACADLNNDGNVNILDASIIGLNWGKIA